jgi:D-alanyl-D-alanine carboxypeptidase
VILGLMAGGYCLGTSGRGGEPGAFAVPAASCVPGGDCPASPSPAVLGAQHTVPEAGPGPQTRVIPGAPRPPAITGAAAFVLEEPCGAALYEFNAHLRLPPASLTKMATALVAVERAGLFETVDVRIDGPAYSLETDSTVMGIEPGDRLMMRDLLYGLLLPSGNDAALEIARHVAGEAPAFVQLMNDKAAELGLLDTHFTNPHGLDEPALYSSAYDIAVLGRALLRHPELAEIVGTRDYQPGWDGPPIKNLNLLLRFYPGAIGIKTGYTDAAGQTIAAAAERNGRVIIVSILGSQTEIYGDATQLLDWAFEDTAPACGAGAPAGGAAGGG